MEQYFNPAISHEELKRRCPGAAEDSAGFDARATRDYLVKRGFLPNHIVRHLYRPFDVRWLYWEPETSLLDRKREEYMPHIYAGNRWIGLAQRIRKEFDSPAITTLPCARHVIERGANLFPLTLKRSVNSLFLDGLRDQEETSSSEFNLSDPASKYVNEIGQGQEPIDVFFHAVAILHSNSYRQNNAGALRQDWPRIPLPATRERLTASAKLGKQIARLQDTDTRINGIDAGPFRLELRPVAVVSSADGQPLDPTTDLAVTAGWGYAGTRGAIMPGHGRAIERPYTPEEETAIAAWRNPLGLDLTDAFPLLGETTFDIYLNDRAYWRNIPSRVWTYTMGGYPVLKKWLSYREQTVLGRPLSLDEARLFQSIARRIAALLLLEPRLDTNYHATTADLYDWSTTASPPATPLALW
jgi:hypothetical protein